MKKMLSLCVVLFAVCLSSAQGVDPHSCPHGAHWVQPPCFYDASGYLVCMPGYWVCN